MVEKTDLSETGTQDALNKLLDLKKPPDAIISFNDYVHLDAVKAALQRGVVINEDIVFASYANISVNKHAAHPPAVSLDQYPYEQGRIAMKMLIDILNEKLVKKEKEISFQYREIAADLVFN